MFIKGSDLRRIIREEISRTSTRGRSRVLREASDDDDSDSKNRAEIARNMKIYGDRWVGMVETFTKAGEAKYLLNFEFTINPDGSVSNASCNMELKKAQNIPTEETISMVENRLADELETYKFRLPVPISSPLNVTYPYYIDTMADI